MIKVKKIRNIIVGGTLATMLGASGLTAVFASNSKTDFTVSTYGYYGEDYDYTAFAEKSTTKSIALVVDSGSGSMDYQACYWIHRSQHNCKYYKEWRNR